VVLRLVLDFEELRHLPRLKGLLHLCVNKIESTEKGKPTEKWTREGRST
jgi:hypothetical protein